MRRSGFTLVELILAMFVLGIGLISVAAMFPAGIAQQTASEDAMYGPIVARNAIDLIRARVRSSDFGTFEEFGASDAGAITRDPVPLTIAIPNPQNTPTTIDGDWGWKRPGLIVRDDLSTPHVDEAGMIDIFSLLYTRKRAGRPTPPGGRERQLGLEHMLTEFPDGIPYVSSSQDQLYGIPYRRDLYDQRRNIRENNFEWRLTDSTLTPPSTVAGNDARNVLREPTAFILQHERYFPAPDSASAVITPPKYVWDCMFRRYFGRIQVAVFVYRVSQGGGIKRTLFPPPQPSDGGRTLAFLPYVVAPADTLIAEYLASAGGSSDPKLYRGRPAIPQWSSSRANSPRHLRRTGSTASIPWGAGGFDGIHGQGTGNRFAPGLDDRSVPGTDAEPAIDPRPMGYCDGWQAPGAVFIDGFGNTHFVVQGRRTSADGPVVLAQPVPRQPYSDALIDRWQRRFMSGGPSERDGIIAMPKTGGDSERGIEDVWFVPQFDANGNDLVPVYASVEYLDA